MLILQDESAEIITNYLTMDVVSFLCIDLSNFVFSSQEECIPVGCLPTTAVAAT